MRCWRESKCGLSFGRAGNVCYCAFRVCSDVTMIVTTWMPVPLNQNGNKPLLIQRLLIVLGTGLSVIRFFFFFAFISCCFLIPYFSFWKKSVCFSFKSHSIPCIQAVSHWAVVGSSHVVVYGRFWCSQKLPFGVCNQLHARSILMPAQWWWLPVSHRLCMFSALSPCLVNICSNLLSNEWVKQWVSCLVSKDSKPASQEHLHSLSGFQFNKGMKTWYLECLVLRMKLRWS